MIGQRISILLLIVAASASFAGCRSRPAKLINITDERAQPSVGYFDGKYKVCRENCPTPTPKELDDSISAETLVYKLLQNAVSLPKPHQAAQQQLGTPTAAQQQLAPQQQALAKVTKTTTEPPTPIPTFDIYFDFSMSKPNKEGRKELRRFAKSVEILQNTRIELIGRTDDVGSRNFNRKLAHKRALHVEAWLKAHGVNAQILIAAKEECCRAAPYNKQEPSLKAKRRVSITFTSLDLQGAQ